MSDDPSKNPNLVLVVSHRTFTHASTSGRTYAFIKGEPIYVPRAQLEDIMRAGVVPAAESDLPTHDPDAKGVDNAPVDPSARKEAIKAGIKQLQKLNDRESFAASGAPKVGALEKVLGFNTSAKEIAPIVQEIHDEAAAAVESEKLSKKA